MDKDFWHQRWRSRELGFHQQRPNGLLVDYFDRLELVEGARVFVPLSGKTLDIGWILSRRCRVVGVELSRIAVEELFSELRVHPTITECGLLQKYSAQDIDIFLGDFFDLNADLLGPVDAVYDRAALVALPEDMRRPYAAHLTRITGTATQLLLCFEYDQDAMDGPPFAVPGDEVRALYDRDYQPVELIDIEFPGGLKGQVAAREHAWLLSKSDAE